MKTYSRLTLAFLLLILVVPQVGADEPHKFITVSNQVPLMSKPDQNSEQLELIKAFRFLLSQARGEPHSCKNRNAVHRSILLCWQVLVRLRPFTPLLVAY